MKHAVSLLAVGLLTSYYAWTDEIVQPVHWRAMNTYRFGPFGQTFTAEDPKISRVGFRFEMYAPAEFTYSLMLGDGLSGPLITSVSTGTVPVGFSDYAYADFSAVTLTVGQSYTLRIAASNDGTLIDLNQWAWEPSGIPITGREDYTGGVAIVMGSLRPYEDLTFRIEPIPEPSLATLLLLGSGLAFVGSRRRDHTSER